jgi:predicted deacylase
MNIFEIGPLRVPSGEVRHGRLPATSSASGQAISVPVSIVHGTQPGPVLLVTGATHGTEITGTRTLLKLIERIDPANLRGTLISVPVTNPLAFDRGTYASPEDDIHLGMPCYWPSDPTGSPTMRIGAQIRGLFDVATHYIDLHNNAEPAVTMSMEFAAQCSSPDVRQVQRTMAEAFGVTPVVMTDPDDGTAERVGSVDGQPAAAASAHGIPGLMVELLDERGHQGYEVGIRGVLNVMSALGMLDDQARQTVERLRGTFTYHGVLMSGESGVLFPVCEPGTIVDQGSVVAHIVGMDGTVVEEVKMPVTGFVWAFLTTPQGASFAVSEGHAVGFIAAVDA